MSNTILGIIGAVIFVVIVYGVIKLVQRANKKGK